jgi:hypothetical protein
VSSKADTPRRGDFGWQALVSAFEPTGARIGVNFKKY